MPYGDSRDQCTETDLHQLKKRRQAADHSDLGERLLGAFHHHSSGFRTAGLADVRSTSECHTPPPARLAALLTVAHSVSLLIWACRKPISPLHF